MTLLLSPTKILSVCTLTVTSFLWLFFISSMLVGWFLQGADTVVPGWGIN